jgi:hypothetical protein
MKLLGYWEGYDEDKNMLDELDYLERLWGFPENNRDNACELLE